MRSAHLVPIAALSIFIADCGPAVVPPDGIDAAAPIAIDAAVRPPSGGPADLAAPLPRPDLLDCTDQDHDGIAACAGDCDDEDPGVRPGELERCDGRDNNCDGRVDEGFEQDGDGWTVCAGDCDDHDPHVHPGARPLCNGRDNNCNGRIDSVEDQDADTFPACNDCDEADPNVNPGAMEVPGDHIDNNCDGRIDEAAVPCDQNLAFRALDAADYAAALDLCPGPFLVAAAFLARPDMRAAAVAPDYGVYLPRAGKNLAVLSTGVAADEMDPGYAPPQDGTSLYTNAPNPLPMGMNCGGQDPQLVYDYVELALTIRVPTNARSMSFDFDFLSAEYPEWVCKAFNDKFLALLDSRAFKGNISFDAKGNPVTVNNGFFTVKAPADLAGTGYETWDGKNNACAGAATGWLTTTTPVAPGEVLTLRFIVFDEGDHILDSAVLLDNLRFHLTPAQNGPLTMRSM